MEKEKVYEVTMHGSKIVLFYPAQVLGLIEGDAIDGLNQNEFSEITIKIKVKYMTQEQIDALPEFEGY